MRLSELDTPCLVLDKGKVDRNCTFLRERVHQLGAELRVHGKTAKNIEAIRLAMSGQDRGITVSTLKEAEYFFENGITDIVYAVGIVPAKLDRVAALTRRGCALSVICDSVAQARACETASRKHGITLPVLIEIDCDGHRCGVQPGDPLLLDIGRILHRGNGVELRGVLTHAGESYNCRDLNCIRKFAELERQQTLRCSEQLRADGLPCPVVSIGSTPTATFTENLTGITEVRAGVHMFMDLVMAGIGVCEVSDIALSVLTSVIGHQKDRGWVIVDAGWMALSADRGTASQQVDRGYGVVCDIHGDVVDNLMVETVNQEHGIVTHRAGEKLDPDRFPIGSMLRILPSHACATGAMHNSYQVIDGGAEVLAEWQRTAGW